MTSTHFVTGGAPGGRPLDLTDNFEVAVNQVLGDRIRADEEFAEQVWAAITGPTWIGPDGTRWGYTYRAAGDIVAAVRREGDYARWYCAAQPYEDDIPSDIGQPLATLGWTWEKDQQDNSQP